MLHIKRKFRSPLLLGAALGVLFICGCSNGRASESNGNADQVESMTAPAFDADSAYSYVKRQVDFGPRVPGTQAHTRTGEWLIAELERRGAQVTPQRATLTAFDGTPLPALNIFARFNPEAEGRTLLLAHWDSRPWADKDPDISKRSTPVDGANDGASGVGVLLEIARQLQLTGSTQGVDILLVDAEDWGSDGDEDSWALGARHFMENISDVAGAGYRPRQAILLDMVGAPEATFHVEYFSQQAAPALVKKIWDRAATLGYGEIFPYRMGGAVTDDHVQLIDHGIPTVDIIDYRADGFDPAWHTTADGIGNISPATLKAVGTVVLSVVNE